jgi:O-antigen ligase
MDSRLDKAIRVGLLLAILFTALAHGAVEPWSVTVFELIVIALMLLWAIRAVAHAEFTIKIPMAALPIAALIVIGLVQSIPNMDSAGRRVGLSMDVEATRRAVMVLFCLFAAFVIAANFFTSRKHLRMLATTLVIYGLMISVFAILQHLTWNGRFYWLRSTYGTSVFGPFANRNHFAGYIGMLVPVPVALIITRGVRRELRLFYGFAAVLMGIAVLVSLSRGGMISLAAGMIFLVLVSVRLARKNKLGASGSSAILIRVGAVVAIAFAIITGAIWIGTEDVVNRVSEALIQDSNRAIVWKDSWAMIRDNPVIGVGLGAFEVAYPIYSHTDGLAVVGYSHNDYLQILVDGGIAGGAVALWFLILVFRALARNIKSKDPLLAGLAVGCGCGIISILVHSMFDFNLQIPSNALLFLFLSAVVTNIGATVGRSNRETALNPRHAKITGQPLCETPSHDGRA